MNENVIRARYTEQDAEADYLCEVARRLASLDAHVSDDVATGMALLYALQTVSVTFEDGFVINDLSDINKTIGNQEAAEIVAALDAAGRPPEFWDDQRFARTASDEDQDTYRHLIERIRLLPQVTRID